MHPSPPCSFDVGGFNNFSTFGGHSRLLTSQTFRMITATSAVRPLHSSHLGDSGITNLSNGIGWEMVKWKIQVKSQQNKVQNQKRKVFFFWHVCWQVIHHLIYHKKQRKKPGMAMHSCNSRKSCVMYAMPEIIMYDTGNGNKLYMPAIVRHFPSTNSMANMRPAYVTDTDTRPSKPRIAKCTRNDNGMYSTNPIFFLKRTFNWYFGLVCIRCSTFLSLTKNRLKNHRPKKHRPPSKSIR